MATLRPRQRPASPADDVQPDSLKKRPRRSKAAPVQHASDDEHGTPPPKKKAVAKGKKAVPLQPVGDGEEVTPPRKKKAASKATKVAPIDLPSDQDEIAQEPKSTGKSKVDVEDESESKAQYAKTGSPSIPVDEVCASTNPHHFVYVDDSTGIIYDAALNQTNASNNNNKFYRIQLLTDGKGDFRTWTRWGRVGERGQNSLLGNGSLASAEKEFEKKFKDKSGLSWHDRNGPPKPRKYVFVEKSYDPDSEMDDIEAGVEATENEARQSRSASPVKCSLDPPVKSLMELIFNQQYMASTMADFNYDAEKLPLGKLSKNTISRGYQALKNLSELFSDPTEAGSEYGLLYGQAVEHLSNTFYSTIPHAFGRNRPPIISTQDMLKREVEMLDSLGQLKDADIILKAEKGASTVHHLDAQYNSLGMREMTPVDQKSTEFAHVNEYLLKTKGDTHSLDFDVKDVFRIERDGETDRFATFAKTNSDRRLLWHGSRSTNYGGILSQGLRIAPPEAPVSGYMFGKGVYLADMSSKSANYCCANISGGHALLLLCEAELGDPIQKLVNASYSAGEDAKNEGLLSTWGQGQVGPKGWKDAGCIHPSLTGVKMPDTTTKPGETNARGAYLMYNEYICYDIAQVRLRYLLRVKMSGAYDY